jgi:phosphonate transport system ATP-binding protein
LFSSHQPDLARRFAQRIIGIRGGRIVFDVPTSELNEDATADLYMETEPMPGIGLRAVS